MENDINIFKPIIKYNRRHMCFMIRFIRLSSEWFSSLSNNDFILSTLYSSVSKANIRKLLFMNQSSGKLVAKNAHFICFVLRTLSAVSL